MGTFTQKIYEQVIYFSNILFLTMFFFKLEEKEQEYECILLNARFTLVFVVKLGCKPQFNPGNSKENGNCI